MFFFVKQKTAYEMRISDWSSDVCSADLHGARDVAARRGVDAAGQDEFLQRRQRLVVVVQVLLEAVDVRVLDRRVAGDAQLAAQVEQLVLDGGQQVADVVRHVRGQTQADGGVGFVDGAVGGQIGRE